MNRYFLLYALYMKNLYCDLICYLAKFAHKSGLYKNWSMIYRRIFQSKYEIISLSKNLNPIEAQKKMNKINWSPDTIYELFDVIGSPHWVECNINLVEGGFEQRKGALDCDEFACWASNTIDEKFKPLILFQNWSYTGLSLKVSGHAVCVVEIDKQLWHCGNWGLIGPFSSLRAVGKNICDLSLQKENKKSVSLLWCLYDRDLNFLSLGNGLPPHVNLDDYFNQAQNANKK